MRSVPFSFLLLFALVMPAVAESKGVYADVVRTAGKNPSVHYIAHMSPEAQTRNMGKPDAARAADALTAAATPLSASIDAKEKQFPFDQMKFDTLNATLGSLRDEYINFALPEDQFKEHTQELENLLEQSPLTMEAIMNWQMVIMHAINVNREKLLTTLPSPSPTDGSSSSTPHFEE